MAHICITKGLDIPLEGAPAGAPQLLETSSVPLVVLDLKPFGDSHWRVLVKVGDSVDIGQPLVEEKSKPGLFLVSPAGGKIADIQRGPKRALLGIAIEVAGQEGQIPMAVADSSASRIEICEALKSGGLCGVIHVRPFSRMADPSKAPRAIFVKALESAPFMPPAELQVSGYEREFQVGLDLLAALTDGAVHLVHRAGSQLRAFTEARHVQIHSAEGPHPIGNSSVHIQAIAPIRGVDDQVWTINARDVVAIGYQLSTGRCLLERVVAIAGAAVLPGKTGYFRVRQGMPVETLMAGRLASGPARLIAGDPLMGRSVAMGDFLNSSDYVLCAIPEKPEREFLHFFGLGRNKYSFSRGYWSGHGPSNRRHYPFTTHQHGERRPFIDGSIYDKVMPLDVPTMHLIKAIMAGDYDSAVELGLLEVDSEDFALPTFICPSKIEMTEIVHAALQQYGKEVVAE
jgi:Na+-transporting NADH:ubiquinone oxidoreductase subunit A